MRLVPKEDEEARLATVVMEEEEVGHVIAEKTKELVEAGSSTMV